MTKDTWYDVNEIERRYYFRGTDEFNILHFEEIKRLMVSKSGNHYLEHKGGLAIVAPQWQAIAIRTANGWATEPQKEKND